MAAGKAYRRLVDKLTKENLWLFIIRLLREKPMYGYEIVYNVKNYFKISVATVTIYVVLYKMVKEGLLKCKVHNGIKYYEVTDKGEEEYKRGLEFLSKIITTLQQ